MRFPFTTQRQRPEALASATAIYRDQRTLLNWSVRVLALGVVTAGGLSGWLVANRWLAERAAPVNAMAHEAQQRIYLSALMLRRISSAINSALEETATIRDLPLPPGVQIERDPNHGLERVLPQNDGLNYATIFAHGASLDQREDRRWLRAVHGAAPTIENLLPRPTVAGTEIIRSDGRALTSIRAPGRPANWPEASRSLLDVSTMASRHRALLEAVGLDAPAAWGRWSVPPTTHENPELTVYQHSVLLEGSGPSESALIVNEVPAAALFAGGDRASEDALSLFVFDSSGQQVVGSREVTPELVSAAREQVRHRRVSFDLEAGEILISEPVADGLFTVVGGIHWTSALRQLGPQLGPIVMLMLLLLAVIRLGRHIVHDRVIAPRWRRAQELDCTRQLLDRVFELSPVGLCIAEAGTSRVTRANAASLALLPELREGMQLHAHLSTSNWSQVEDTRSISERVEQTILRRDGKHGPEVLEILRSRADEHLAVLALVDRFWKHSTQTAPAHALTNAERPDAAMRHCVATESQESREIRTPLTGVCSGLGRRERSPSSTEAPRRIESDRRPSATLKKSVDELPDLSTIEAGRIELTRSPGRLRDEISAISELYREAATAKGLEFHVRVSREVPATLSLDWTRIRQVLGNLVDNAIKFTARGQIIVWVGMSGPCELKLSIIDTGRGIPADQLHRLFRPFARLQEGEDRGIPGTGRGLSLARRLCELHGGQLDVSSIEHVGSHFRVLLPIDGQEPVTAVSNDSEEIQRSRQVSANDQALRVLLVEDEPTCRLVIAEQLKLLGADVTTVDSAERAMAQLRETTSCRPDCVITDLGLPGIQGDALARAIRAGDVGQALNSVPILGLTGSVVPAHRLRCLESGMNAVLLKPFAMDDLRRIFATMNVRRPPSTAPGWTKAHSDRATVSGLERLFLDSLRADMRLIEEARLRDDWAAVGRRAHRIAGAAAVMRIEPLRLAALEVEFAIQDSQVRQQDRLERLQAAVAAVLALQCQGAATAMR